MPPTDTIPGAGRRPLLTNPTAAESSQRQISNPREPFIVQDGINRTATDAGLFPRGTHGERTGHRDSDDPMKALLERGASPPQRRTLPASAAWSTEETAI